MSKLSLMLIILALMRLRLWSDRLVYLRWEGDDIYYDEIFIRRRLCRMIF